MNSLLPRPQLGCFAHPEASGDPQASGSGNLRQSTTGQPAWALVLAAMLASLPALAFPPAPHHLIYGTVRDEYGTPLTTSKAQVLLTTPTGVQLTTSIVPGVWPGINFELEVPMDSGLTSDPYEPSALITAAPFTISVVTGQTTNVPIQMTGDYSRLGQPGQTTRIDLTLGVDANGDGIPDAWEYAFLQATGSGLSLSQLNPAMDFTGDGRTLLQEFLLGNYPFNTTGSFAVTLVDVNGGSPILQFDTMTGRSYTLLGSPDLGEWTPLAFTLPSEANAVQRAFYYAQSISTVRIQVVQPDSGPTMHYFQLVLQ